MTEDQEPEDSLESALLKTLVMLAEHRRLTTGGMLTSTLFTALIVFIMSVTYTASTVIVTSQTTAGSASALLGELESLGALASLGG